MRKAAWSSWQPLGAHTRELSLRRTLLSGQSFRWRERRPTEWVGVVGRTAFALKESGDSIDFAFCHPESAALTAHEAKSRLRDYFYLDRVHLTDYYQSWGSPPPNASRNADSTPAPVDPRHDINKAFQSVAQLLPGLRLLRQDPEECLFAFICSQNNNVKRITGMVEAFSGAFGDVLCEDEGRPLHAFPTIARIATLGEQELRELGFGYRAKYIPKAAKEVLEREAARPGWLRELRTRPREEVVQELQQLTGVGPKVADCISLFSLDKVDLVPVDTHVWQITERFMPSLRGKNLSPVLYKAIGNFWREKFGEWAGWAHTVMFAAELSNFRAEIFAISPKKEGKAEGGESKSSKAPKKAKKEPKGKRKGDAVESAVATAIKAEPVAEAPVKAKAKAKKRRSEVKKESESE